MLSLHWLMLSASCIVIGVCGVLVMRTYMGKFFGGEKSAWIPQRVWWVHLTEIVCVGLVVFGLTLLLGESGLFSNFFRRQIGDIFVSINTDPAYMRQNLLPERIREIRIAATEALCQQYVEKGPGSFLELIENDIYPTLDAPVRENLDVYYEHKIIEVGGERALKVYQVSKWTLRNLSTNPIEYVQKVQSTLDPVEGVEPQDLFKIVKFAVGGRDREIYTEPVRTGDERFVFNWSYSFTISGSEEVMVIIERIIPFTNTFTLWMMAPTKGIRFAYRHPPSFRPSIYVFGLGDEPVRLLESTGDYHVWIYRGWLLKKHGVLLQWSLEDK